ncbi:hypothetical protein AAHE18_08G022200 [Arachis hypogaea]
MCDACEFLDENCNSKTMVFVTMVKHHTRLFQSDCTSKLLMGKVIDNDGCHPRNFDFYQGAHARMIVDNCSSYLLP